MADRSDSAGTTLKRQRSNSNDLPPNSSDKRQNTGTPVVKREPGAAVKLEEGEGGVEGGKSASPVVKMELDSSNATAVPAENNGTAPATGAASLPAAPVAATAAQQPASASTEAAAPQITIRALIVTGDASIIIGKAGSHIKEIRERAGARVSVSEQIPGNTERILNVSGPLDAVSKAYGLIVRKINDEPYDSPSVPGSRAVTIKYIVPNGRMGSVIGKGGSKIKEIQEASGARLQASETMLPGSTERILNVSGVADAVHIAVYYVGTILQEGLDRAPANTAYRPSAAGPGYAAPPAGGSSYMPGQQMPSRGGGGGYGGAPGYQGGMAPPAGGYGYGGPAPPAPGGDMYAAASTATAPGSQTQQIYIPNDLVGNIIGKGGAKINEIRQASGCSIKIMEPTESQGTGVRDNERLVQITGLPRNIQTAVQMLHSRLEQEKARKLATPAY